ncbi:MAG: methyltransferase family protein [bacterium]
MNSFVELGKFFYRYRDVITLPFLLLLFILGRTESRTILPHLFIICGIVIRLWSAGYIGEKSRGRQITADYKIISAPYRILRHPLYIGNFLLVLGTIILYNPPLWYGLLLMIIFMFEYSVIIFAEEKYLRNVQTKKVGFIYSNLKGEVSTIIVMVVIYLIYFAKM